ncbi:MAG: hypothetical protein QGD94_12760, partial [Planctomycetia bacterium]|nr:hypothetical protein [Planctomycetia bacterium]
AIALAHAGMTLMADDTSFVIRPDAGAAEGLAVWGLPRPCKVHVATFDLLPWLNDLPRRPARTEDEFLIDLRDVSGGDSLQTASPGIVLFLEQRCDGEHAITPVGKMTAVGRLARENVRAVDKRAEGAAGDAFRTLVRLIDLSDTYLLSVGPRLDNLYEKIIGLLGG